ncbi:hypothetical protein ID866_1514 [Astraeus odoratus]|nr:hypothetical protein ID866_1514 [Astraeus odoratus]
MAVSDLPTTLVPASSVSSSPGSLPRYAISREKPLPPMPSVTALSTSDMDEHQLVIQNSWADSEIAEMDQPDLDFLTARPSPYSPNSATSRPRAPAPSPTPAENQNQGWSPDLTTHSFNAMSGLPLDSAPLDTSPTVSPHVPHALSRSVLARSLSESESSFHYDSSPPRSFARPPKVPAVDPSLFPDPYPHHRLPYSRISDRISSTLPGLSSAGSSSASTRSSAYTSSGSAQATSDYGHVHIASGDDEEIGIAVGITSDDVARVLAGENTTSSSAGRTPIDQTRWSEYSASIRSRSSSIGASHTHHEGGPPRLRENPSFDMGWQTVDERDEAGLTSGDETDDLCEEEETTDEKADERTSAIVVAEEGRALIVKGDGSPISQLNVQSGTTHLLIGSSSTPNSVPTFLTGVLPRICHTLLALDISANFLVALPPALASCESLEELNIASNPLRVLPVFLSHLVSLRVLIADATGVGTLPDSLCGLDRLHTLSIRRNRMHALPSWLCLLPSLQELYLDGNPFQGPWQALVEPLLSKAPTTPLYPPTPSVFSCSTPLPSSSTGPETDTDDSEVTSADIGVHFSQLNEDETITPSRAPPLGRSATSPAIVPPVPPASERGLTRTRTAPNNRAYYAKTRPRMGTTGEGISSSNAPRRGNDTDREPRKMKSAGELRTSFERPREAIQNPPIATPIRPAISASASSSNLLNLATVPPESDKLVVPKRYASLGVSAFSPTRNATRPMLTQSLFDNKTEGSEVTGESVRSSVVSPPTSPPRPSTTQDVGHMTPSPMERQGNLRQPRETNQKERGGRWGFLKKMSMGKMRPEPPGSPRPNTTYGRLSRPDGLGSPGATSAPSPQIDVRFSTTGSLGPMPTTTPLVALSPAPVQEETEPIPVPPPPPAATGGFLAPSGSPTPRATKRRSFLPIDGSTVSSLTAPSPTSFVTETTLVGEGDEASEKSPAPSPVALSSADRSELTSRREERAKEAYTRALRSVMAYLRDMNDLSLSQGNPISVYGTVGEESPTVVRSRRPTVIDRTHSEPLSAISRAASISGQLRSAESMAGLRSGTASQTVSVATTDSSCSSEERKYKDDKGKRALIIREIVETERTYVKGLQELVDIYIKPSAAPVNLIGGVGSGKETIIPAAERKIVFGGVEALFSFHNESFLPALETAAVPLMKKPEAGEELDADGQLSVEVTKAVAGIFLKHAAFMRMYSSYINNFDNSVQRIKYWSTDRPNGPTSPGAAVTPTNVAGLTAVSVPGAGNIADSSATGGIANLTSGQKKRIKSFLKRCRMNPRHSQLNLEGYLLLPVQRIPRYRLLLEELLRSTPPTYAFMDDALDRALAEISSLANNMNEGKRESESRRKLVQWQSRIRGKFPSPLVQPHRRLIMDGPLMLTRVVRKTVVSFETFNAQGDASAVQVECLAPELTPRPLVGILCNDLLVLCRDPSDGKDPLSPVDLWAVLRMQTLPQPASIVHGNALRIVDNKAILYFDAPSPSEALTWFRAINLHIPASKA